MNKNELIITEFDQSTIRGSTQIIKALIPFLAPREQKMIGIMIRIWELILTLRFFERSCIPTREHSTNATMINHIKQYCTPESQKTIDMLLNFMNMSELMKIMNVFDGENGPNNPFDSIFKNFSGGQNGFPENTGSFANGFAEGFPNNLPQGFSMSNLAEIINMFQTFSNSTTDDLKTDTSPDSHSDSQTDSQFNSHSSSTHDPGSASIQPASLLQSMMNPAQADLYEEFMEKLNQTMDD